MIHTTMEIRGVKLDVVHDGTVVYEIWSDAGEQDLLPVLSKAVVREAEGRLPGVMVRRRAVTA